MLSEPYASYLISIVLFGVIAVFTLWVGKRKGFFLLVNQGQFPFRPSFLLNFFFLYVGTVFLLAPLLARLLRTFLSPLHTIAWMQFLMLAILLGLFSLYGFSLNAPQFKRMWKDRTVRNPSPISHDFLIGIGAWAISFPLVSAVGQIADLFLYSAFQFHAYEQVAVRYLKMSLSSPEALTIALLTILFAAPIVEEFAFRGVLQNFCKCYMRPKLSIGISALVFAFFHFSMSQGLGNISLLLALFVFACFLGYVYERQASLFAPIALHMTFNAASTMQILFFL
jgi:CAAX protease family protein